MKALILTGGLGTRLRPFTCELPKPLLPVVNRPFLHYQFEVLRRHGLREVTLATAYRAEAFRRVLGDGRGTGLKVRYVHERSPLGTGGAIRNALPRLAETALVLNGDVLQSFDVDAFLRHHRRTRADASLSLIRVPNPTQYGLVETEPDGRVRRFLEKPSWDEVTCNTVNAGAYLLEPGVVSLIPRGVPHSVERTLFPQLLDAGRRVYGFITKGYWMDIGTVDKYLQAHLDVLGGLTPFKRPPGRSAFLAEGSRLDRTASHEGEGKVALGAGSRVGPNVRFVGSVSVGPGCVVEQGAHLERCVILGGTKVGKGARLERCIVGRRCQLGAHSTLGQGRTLGDGSRVAAFSQL